ncbi:unnamed protein product [Timema podura]|uniref:Uncharacterized protein n=1 Tax=Timema podura TaxID=61482 RepID=A0ABN7NP57_TIMPD|nr:unnamed protein product [Timema podura]
MSRQPVSCLTRISTGLLAEGVYKIWLLFVSVSVHMMIGTLCLLLLLTALTTPAYYSANSRSRALSSPKSQHSAHIIVQRTRQ